MSRGAKRKNSVSATTKGQIPKKINRGNNHCYVRNIYDPDRESDAPIDENVATGFTSSPNKHILSSEAKLEIIQRMQEWRAAGSKTNKSPIASLCAKFKCNRHYPGRLLKKVASVGTIENQWNSVGRPKVFGPELREQILKIVEHNSNQHETSPARKIRSTLMKQCRGRKVPSEATINRAKREMKFRFVKIKTKPLLNKAMMKDRLKYAKTWHKADWSRNVHIDEKWFTEEKSSSLFVEFCKGMKLKKKFKGVQAETRTQLKKLMYLAAVCESGRVKIIKLDWSGYFKVDKNGVQRQGHVDSTFLLPFWKKIHFAAKKLLGPGVINIVLDRASSHTSKCTQLKLAEIFDNVIVQPPKSPDFNLLDAYVFPQLEKKCNKKGAVSHDEIERAVKAVWKTVTKETMQQAVKRVKTNMGESIGQRGGNFYCEGN